MNISIILAYMGFTIVKIILQIVSITGVNNRKENSEFSRNWSIFLGITIASIIVDIIGFMTTRSNINALDIGSGLFLWISFAASAFTNLLMLGIGIPVKLTRTQKAKFDSKTILCGIFTAIVVIMIGTILFVLIPLFTQNSKGAEAINYLKDKYGDNNYKVISIEDNYYYEGWTKHYNGYKATISVESENTIYYVTSTNKAITDTKTTKEAHQQSIQDAKEELENFTNQMNLEIATQEYYESKIRTVLANNKYNLRNMSVWVNIISMPTYDGKTPTLDQLVKDDVLKYILIKDMDFKCNTNDEKTAYIKNLSVVVADLLVNDLNISKDIKLSIHFMGEVKAPYFHTVKYYIEIENNTLKICEDDYKKSVIAQCSLDVFRNMGK